MAKGHQTPIPDSKMCRVCGRRFAWRAKWARDWPSVRHCSQRCRRRGLQARDHELETAIMALLRERSGKSICPSEAARRVDAERGQDLMEPARMAARRLWHAGRIRITQRGRAVDPDAMRGPVQLSPPG